MTQQVRSMPEQFNVFRKNGKFLCTQPSKTTLFWGNQIEMALRGRDAQKLKSCVRRIAGRSGQDANAFMEGAAICRTDVVIGAPRKCITSAPERYSDAVQVMGIKDGQPLFVGYVPNGGATEFASKAIGFKAVPQSQAAIGEAGGLVCRHYAVTPKPERTMQTGRNAVSRRAAALAAAQA